MGRMIFCAVCGAASLAALVLFGPFAFLFLALLALSAVPPR
jgi:hypothetical protein